MSIAETILAQLGGAQRVQSMIGRTYFLAHATGLSLKFQNRKGPNYCLITLDAATDTYCLQFSRGRRKDGVLSYSETARIDDAQAEDLIPFFESETGLALRL